MTSKIKKYLYFTLVLSRQISVTAWLKKSYNNNILAKVRFSLVHRVKIKTSNYEFLNLVIRRVPFYLDLTLFLKGFKLLFLTYHFVYSEQICVTHTKMTTKCHFSFHRALNSGAVYKKECRCKY